MYVPPCLEAGYSAAAHAATQGHPPSHAAAQETEKSLRRMDISNLELIPQRKLHNPCAAARHNAAEVPIVIRIDRIAQGHMVEGAIKLAAELDLSQPFGNGKCFGERKGVAPVPRTGQEISSGAAIASWLVGRKRGDVEILKN